MRTRTAAACLLAAAALLTGCSSGSDHAASPTPSPSTALAAATTTSTPTTDDRAALEAAVRAYSGAYFKPDPAAGYALLSARCKADLTADAYAAELATAVATYGHQAVKDVTVDQLSGPLARVTYTYSVPVLTQQGQAWTREGGAWHYDDC